MQKFRVKNRRIPKSGTFICGGRGRGKRTLNLSGGSLCTAREEGRKEGNLHCNDTYSFLTSSQLYFYTRLIYAWDPPSFLQHRSLQLGTTITPQPRRSHAS